MVSGSESVLILIVTKECKFNCKVCPIEKKKERMQYKIAKESIELFLKEHPFNGLIKFFGGEPLLNFSLIKSIVEEFEKKDVKFNLTTNFLNFKTHFLKFFIEHPSVELILSTGDKKNQTLLNLIKKIKNLPNVIFNINFWPSNLNFIEENVKTLLEHGFSKFNFLPAYYVEWKSEEISLLREKMKKIKKIILSSSKRIHIKNLNTFSPLPLFSIAPTVDCDGDIYWGNFFLHKNFLFLKDFFKIDNVSKIREWNYVEQVSNFFYNNVDFKKILSLAFPKKILFSTFEIDNILNDFLQFLK